MQTYVIQSPDFSAVLVEDDNLVVQTGPLLSWACGRTFSFARNYIETRGWSIQPLVNEENEHPRWLEIDGYAYELHWKGDALKRVSLHRDGEIIDLCYEQIPSLLQKLII